MVVLVYHIYSFTSCIVFILFLFTIFCVFKKCQSEYKPSIFSLFTSIYLFPFLGVLLFFGLLLFSYSSVFGVSCQSDFISECADLYRALSGTPLGITSLLSNQWEFLAYLILQSGIPLPMSSNCTITKELLVSPRIFYEMVSRQDGDSFLSPNFCWEYSFGFMGNFPYMLGFFSLISYTNWKWYENNYRV